MSCRVGRVGLEFLRDYIINQSGVSARGYIQVEYDRPRGIGASSKRKKDLTYFNPWSINLYNEEIKEIIASGGLIGLNLDQRIQGADKVKGEYFSALEFEALMHRESFPLCGHNKHCTAPQTGG